MWKNGKYCKYLQKLEYILNLCVCAASGYNYSADQLTLQLLQKIIFFNLQLFKKSNSGKHTYLNTW